MPVWIKKTKVRQGGKEHLYYQLMKTLYTSKGSRQVVVANLGRAEDVDFSLAKKLAASITDDSYFFLPEEYLNLLHTKFHGETFLLNKAFEITSLRRFSEDRASYKGLPTTSVDALFFLMAYYAFQKGEENAAEFSRRYYVRNFENIDADAIRGAFALLRDAQYIHPGIMTSYRNLMDSGSLKYYFSFSVSTEAPFSHTSGSRITLLTDKNALPLKFWIGWGENLPIADENSLFVFDFFAEELIHTNRPMKFIARINQRQLVRLFTSDQIAQINAVPCSKIYGDLMYGSVRMDEYNLMVLRAAGTSPNTTKSPTEIVITNNAVPVHEVLNCLNQLDAISDCFYRVFLPEDLHAICANISTIELNWHIVALHFLHLFLEHQLSIRLKPLNLSAQDAYDIFRSMRIVSLKYCNQKQLIHSLYTPMQARILELLAFN